MHRISRFSHNFVHNDLKNNNVNNNYYQHHYVNALFKCIIAVFLVAIDNKLIHPPHNPLRNVNVYSTYAKQRHEIKRYD